MRGLGGQKGRKGQEVMGDRGVYSGAGINKAQCGQEMKSMVKSHGQLT